jgi:hypothetical protein
MKLPLPWWERMEERGKRLATLSLHPLPSREREFLKTP